MNDLSNDRWYYQALKECKAERDALGERCRQLVDQLAIARAEEAQRRSTMDADEVRWEEQLDDPTETHATRLGPCEHYVNGRRVRCPPMCPVQASHMETRHMIRLAKTSRNLVWVYAFVNVAVLVFCIWKVTT